MLRILDEFLNDDYQHLINTVRRIKLLNHCATSFSMLHWPPLRNYGDIFTFHPYNVRCTRSESSRGVEYSRAPWNRSVSSSKVPYGCFSVHVLSMLSSRISFSSSEADGKSVDSQTYPSVLPPFGRVQAKSGQAFVVHCCWSSRSTYRGLSFYKFSDNRDSRGNVAPFDSPCVYSSWDRRTAFVANSV